MRTLEKKIKMISILALCLMLALVLAWGSIGKAAAPAAGGANELLITGRQAGTSIDLKGEVLVIQLASNPATGYSWQVAGMDSQVLNLVSATEWLPDEPGKIGGPGTQTLRFAGVGRGQTTLHLVYARAWEKATTVEKTFSLDVNVFEPSTDVSIPQPEVVGIEALAPEDYVVDALPTAFSWCAQSGCTPVRNQASCGSCWAFATVGALEQNILIKDGIARDLSEQYLVSCNSDGWDCDGGWWAHDYHEWKYLSAQLFPGARYESDFPYTATNGTCSKVYTAHEKIADWIYVGTSYSVPTTTAIKQAIYDHGPVSAAVCVDAAFQGYTGGVFNPATSCTTMNHGIVLVGWDDSVGAWILRNSWGAGWGEAGYMRIAYGKNNVGYAATYVVYNGSTPPSAPTNLAATAVSSSQINLSWNDTADNETGFKIERSPDGIAWVQIATTTAASYADTGLAASTTFFYQVRAYNSVGDSAYSNAASTTTQDLPLPPIAPTNLAATAVSSNQINLSWSDSDTETGYRIERCSGVDCNAFEQIATAAANATSFSNTGLSASTSYSYRLVAFNDGGNSDYSNIATAVTAAPPAGAKLYLGSSTSGTAGGVSFADEDVLIKDMGTGAWTMYIDGSDIGLTNTDIDAFDLQADGSLLLSFDSDFSLSGFGTVDDSDILKFTPSSTGSTTAGTWAWYFDGSDVGLSTSDEDVDALDVLADGRLVISVLGNVSVTGVSGVDEDLLVFTPTALGATTSGTWAWYFDGSDVGLSSTSNEDVNGVWIDAAGKIHLTTLGSFSVTGVSGDGSDVFACTPSALGSTTACTWAMVWDGSVNGFSGEDTDSLFIVP